MTILFDANSILQNDQTAGTQTTNGDTDVAYGDSRLASLIATVAASGYAADTAFATLVSGAYSQDVMTVSGDGAISGLKFVDPDGGTLDGDPSGLTTVDGDEILLYSSDDGRTVYGVYTDGTGEHLAFAVQMNVTTVNGVATVDLVTISYAPIESPTAGNPDENVNLGDYLFISAQDNTGFDFSALASTKFLFGVVGSTDGGFLVIGKDPVLASDGTPATGGNAGDTVNSSQGGGGVTIGINNQQFTGDSVTNTAEEGAYFTYIKGMAAGTYQDADLLLPTEYISVVSAKLQISQVQGNGTQGMRLTALDYDGSTDGRDFVSDLTTASQGDIVHFLTIHVYNADGTDTTVTKAEFDAGTDMADGLVVTKDDFTFILRDDGSVDILGLGAKDWVEWTTDGLHDRMLVEVLSGKWDIGGFEVVQLNTEITSIGGQIQFGDDAPAVDLVLDGTAQLVLDESTGTDANDPNADDGAPLAQQSIAAADYLSSVSAAFGTDGAGADLNDDVWSLSTTAGADSGLVAVGSGLHVFLFLEDGAIVGREGIDADAAETGDEVLRFAIDADTGEVTVTQSLALTHDDPTDGDDSVSLTGSGLVVVTRTLTDADDDPAHDSADLTGIFVFEDDAPTVTTNDPATPDLTTSDADYGTDASASFAGFFTADYGNDGQADSDALAYALGIKSDGVDSGLTDTLTGDAIKLTVVNGEVVGYLSGDPATVAFVISVDADGTVTLDQQRAVVHNDPDDAEESGASAAGFAAADLVTLTATVTDGDGDTDSATVNIADSFHFTDDGVDVALSDATPDPLVTDDTTLGSDGPVDLSGLFDVTYGNDGTGDAVAYALGLSDDPADSGLTDTLSGDRILLRLDANGNVEGYLEGDTATVAFSVTLDTATGEVTLTQSRSIAHDDPNDGEETGDSAAAMASGLITLTATATDGDGDHDAATANIGDLFRFEDDKPSVTRSAAEMPLLVTDDSDLPSDTDSTSFAGLFTIDSGNDGAADPAADVYELGIKSANIESGFHDTATGSAILLRVVDGVVEGYLADDDTQVAFTIAVDADGVVTLTQLSAIQHDDPEDPDETAADGKAEQMASDLVTLKLTTADGDGDTASATIDIGDAFAFEDDGPTVSLKTGTLPVLTVSDSTLGEAGPVAFAGFFDFDFGKDGEAATDPVVYTLGIKSVAAESGLTDTLTGDAILLKVEDGVVKGYLADHPTDIAFTISVSADGKITLEQLRAVQHNDPLDPEELGASAAQMTLADLITLQATITDGDGDHDTQSLDITATFRFTDDGPTFAPLEDLVVDFDGSGSVKSDSALLDFDTGNDGYKTVRITDYDPTLQVNGKTLTGVLNSAATLLTYYFDANNNGQRDAGEDAFTYELKDLLGADGLAGTDGILDTAVFTILNVPASPNLDYDFRDLPAGQNGFGILSGRSAGSALPNPDGPSILIVGNKAAYNPDHTFSNSSSTINTSKGGGPTTIGVSNQMIDPKEAVWFSYLADPENSYVSGITGGLSQSEADDFDNIQFKNNALTEVNEAFFKVVQVQGNPKVASLEINAYDLDEEHKDLQGIKMVDELNRLGLASVTAGDEPEQVTITSVTINQTEYDRSTGDIANFIDWQDDGGVTLLKVVAGDTIIFETEEAHDAALITGISGKFDIGDYGIDQSFDTPDLSLDVELTLTDGDGDWTTEMQSILVDGTGLYNDNVLT